ncbi:MAG: phosphoadenosine phosphosulfate reductase family protein [Lachnospiraceae bacterium]|nr:phosphoadenosine phosphosulfate reductase family protein [Lachnospiraceae bacterium]
MYAYEWDSSTGGYVLTPMPLAFSKEPRPVYYKELDILGFDKYWDYDKNDSFPYMWAEANNYIYRGRVVAKIKGGSLYTAPEIILVEDPEPEGYPLRFVDIPEMVNKNRAIMEQLTQDTIKKIYNIYTEHKNKVDVFYVAFSGGKDSVVVLDLVQKALPHNEFKVLFGDTDMEFPTTLKLVEKVSQECALYNIEFYSAKAPKSAEETWDAFGPPARKVRWCCTVHKTAPVINKLNELFDKKYVRTMMITGVRGDESSSRSEYDELSKGKKIAGQYSFHPILEWSSAEIYLYMYENNLEFNEAYKYGFNRVGCIMCPNSSEKHEYMKRMFFEDEVMKFTQKIIDNSAKDLSGDNAKKFMDIGGWKTRLSGRELKFSEDERFTFEEHKDRLVFKVIKLNDKWKEWYKTVGRIQEIDSEEFILEYNGTERRCKISYEDQYDVISVENFSKTKNAIEFVYYFKSVLAKSQYCIQCGTCEAECPYRNIEMKNGKISISDSCIKCHECLKILYGCLYYNSIRGSKIMKKLTGINKYLSVGVDANWIEEYAKDNSFEPGNRKTDVMFGFLSDAELVKKKQITSIGKVVFRYELDDVLPWAIMLCNLAYSSQFGWFIKNIPFFDTVTLESVELRLKQEDVTDKAVGEFWNGFKAILGTTKPLNEIGFGIPEIEEKVTKTGDVKKKMLSFYRLPWENPDERVILYSLYKFAEECGNRKQFDLTELMDDSIERGGVSPTLIFGLDRDTMEKVLNGLTFNYPDLIEARFTHGLDNITLKSDMSAAEIFNELF